MTKPKTKLVQVGWGIMVDPNNHPGKRRLIAKTCGAETEEEAIQLFDGKDMQSHANYKSLHEKGFAIAKKLWVEVEG